MTTKRKAPIYLVCGILALAVLAGLFYVVSTRYVKHIGIQLKAPEDHPLHQMDYYLQNDPRWAAQTIGDSSSSLGSTGCLISSVATVMTDLGVTVTPETLNEALTPVGGFQGAVLIWLKINQVYPEIDYRYSRLFSGGTILRDLKNGQYPIVKVNYHRTGVEHWVIIVGAKDGDFLAYDPFNSKMEPIPLYQTHGKVYGYRVLEKVTS